MTGFNMPSGCSVSDIPGNRPEDEAYEAAWEWAGEELQDFSVEEFHRAVLIGKAAVLAEREVLQQQIHQAYLEGCVEGETRAREQ